MPEETVFRTEGQLAQLMLRRALESGVLVAWFTGDEVYASDRNLRLWLERQDVPHTLGIKRNEKLWALTEKGPRQVRADRLASQVAGQQQIDICSLMPILRQTSDTGGPSSAWRRPKATCSGVYRNFFME